MLLRKVSLTSFRCSSGAPPALPRDAERVRAAAAVVRVDLAVTSSVIVGATCPVTRVVGG